MPFYPKASCQATMLSALLWISLCGVSTAAEQLYNGIVLPDDWPPTNLDPASYAPSPVPYLERENVPKVIPIDVGRQLFVDDFLIEDTNLERVYHNPRNLRQS